MRSAYNDHLLESPSPLWGGVRGGGIHDGRGLRFPPSPTLPHKGGGNPRAVCIAALRRAVARLETAAPGAEVRHLPLGVPEMQAHLQGPGLACGVLHEVAAAAHGDRPAAFGFLFALTAATLLSR